MSTVIKVTTNIANVKFLRSTNEVPKDLNYGCFCLVLYFVIFFCSVLYIWVSYYDCCLGFAALLGGNSSIACLEKPGLL